MRASEWGIDPDHDPRSFEAAVQWRAVREAEQIVERAEHGPDATSRLVSTLFAKLKEAEDEQ